MLPRIWTPEAAKAGVKQEDIEAANERAAQTERAGLQAELARIPALRAQATDCSQCCCLGLRVEPFRRRSATSTARKRPPIRLWQRGSSLSYSSSGDRQR
jgi:hypothetical protein